MFNFQMSWDTLISHQSTLNKNGELDMNLFDTQNFLRGGSQDLGSRSRPGCCLASPSAASPCSLSTLLSFLCHPCQDQARPTHLAQEVQVPTLLAAVAAVAGVAAAAAVAAGVAASGTVAAAAAAERASVRLLGSSGR